VEEANNWRNAGSNSIKRHHDRRDGRDKGSVTRRADRFEEFGPFVDAIIRFPSSYQATGVSVHSSIQLRSLLQPSRSFAPPSFRRAALSPSDNRDRRSKVDEAVWHTGC